MIWHVHFAFFNSDVLFQVVNVNEIQALMAHEVGLPLESSEKGVEVMRDKDAKIITRTTTRVSLTCRLVLKVHKNLFKF